MANNLKLKKIIAREFLVLLFSALILGLVYGCFSVYNWNAHRKIAKFELNIKELKAEDVYRSFNEKKASRIDFFDGYRMYLSFYSEESRTFVI
jgi:hypothetical protein